MYKRFGSGAVGLIKDNPYILCDGDVGISFEKADEIARTLGAANDSIERILSGVKYIFSYNANMNGHTCLPKDKLITAAIELLGLSREVISDSVEHLLDVGELSSYTVDNRCYVMPLHIAEAEDLIVKRI